MAPLGFRPLAELDLPQLACWLEAPHVGEWWRAPSDLESVRAKYLPRIHGREPTEVFVIVHGGEDVGIIQRYRLSAHPRWNRTLEAAGHRFSSAAGIDYLIGVPEQLGKGLGTRVVRDFTRSLFADLPDIERIVVAPQQQNRPSCRVLEHAGYDARWTGRLDSDDPADAGTAILYVLERDGLR